MRAIELLHLILWQTQQKTLKVSVSDFLLT